MHNNIREINTLQIIADSQVLLISLTIQLMFLNVLAVTINILDYQNLDF